MSDPVAPLPDDVPGRVLHEWRRSTDDRFGAVVACGITAALLLVPTVLLLRDAVLLGKGDTWLMAGASAAGVAVAAGLAVNLWLTRARFMRVGEGGIEYVRGRRRVLLRWSDVESMRDLAFGRGGTRLVPLVQVNGRDGTRIEEHGGWDLTAAIERGLTPFVAERARAAIATGATFEFGPFAVSRDGLRHAGTLHPWAAVRGVVRLWEMDRFAEIGIRTESGNDLLRERLSDVPNARAFAMLVREMTGGRAAYELQAPVFKPPGWEEPEAALEWVLIYSDTFDRDSEPSEERKGTGLLAGLSALWHRVLSEGVLDSGSATFSAFSLHWTCADRRGRIDLPPAPFNNRALAELRCRVFPPSEAEAALPPDKRRPGVEGRRCDDAVLRRIAEIHGERILAATTGSAPANAAPDADPLRALVREALGSAA